MATSFQPKGGDAVASNGTSDVTIRAAPATGKTGIVIHVSGVNLDAVPHTFILKKNGGTGAKERARVAGVAAGDYTDQFPCNVNQPIHLEAGETLVGALGEAQDTTAPIWWVDSYEGTD